MKALIIVDVQNDFLPGGALAVAGGNEIIPVINELQSHFDMVVATQDWHPADHQSFASQHPSSKVFDIIQLNGMDQVLWPDHCVQETEGAAFSHLLDTKKTEAIFRKGMDKRIDSYSGFFDNGKIKSTGLGDFLKGKGVSSLFITGLAGDFCVNYTALDGLFLGFESTIITNATKAIDPLNFEKAMKTFVEKGGKLINNYP